ncbi:invasion associated locus B family protein [Stappia sp. F7233]|uniref:Invasion associated locus B family protein n=1 Tax=Stappia albiluteola TaxID=2758565 RepID=A0A839AIN5_9HYPH|nr:invasion associated locus B family protein [Stappia albiluteola]MBA5778379.1 invasion associated locus B family protein [Stappia albiluteola]
MVEDGEKTVPWKIYSTARRDARDLRACLARHAATALVALALAASGGAPVAKAQGEVRTVHGDWQMRCDTPPGAKEEQCALIQNVTAEDRENVGLSVIVLKTADKKTRLLRVLAPLGVLIPTGLGLRVDGDDIGNATFVRCLPTGCISEAVLQDDLIAKFETGETATFVIFQTPEEGIGIPISLKGFKEGFAALP